MESCCLGQSMNVLICNIVGVRQWVAKHLNYNVGIAQLSNRAYKENTLY